MGIVLGYLSLICFCMLVAKWIARRCNLIKFDTQGRIRHDANAVKEIIEELINQL